MVLGTILFYVAVAINTLSYMYLIFKIWRTKSCAGLSGKTHILYAVAYTARCADFFSLSSTSFHKYVDLVHLVFICIIILSLFVFFKETREPQYDTFRVELLVICCFAVATMVNAQHRFDLQPVLWAFSIYLQAVAMLPQFRVISETRHLHTHIYGYLIAVVVGQFVYLMYLFCHDYYFPTWVYDKNLNKASIVVQLILSLDFFLRVSPIKLQIVTASPEIKIVGDQETGDGGIKSDSLMSRQPYERQLYERQSHHAHDNVMSNIILTPAALLNTSPNEKVDLLKVEEAK